MSKPTVVIFAPNQSYRGDVTAASGLSAKFANGRAEVTPEQAAALCKSTAGNPRSHRFRCPELEKAGGATWWETYGSKPAAKTKKTAATTKTE